MKLKLTNENQENIGAMQWALLIRIVQIRMGERERAFAHKHSFGLKTWSWVTLLGDKVGSNYTDI